MTEPLLEASLAVVFALHLACMNVSAAGPFVCCWLEWREGRGDRTCGDAAGFLGSASLYLLVIGSALGVGVGYFLMTPNYWGDTLGRLAGKLNWALWELVFYVVLMAVYVVWQRVSRESTWQRWVRIVLLLLAGSNLMYHFPPLLSVVSKIATDNDPAGAVIGAEAFRSLMFEPVILSKWIHFGLAAFAFCGVVLVGYSMRARRQGANEQEADGLCIAGGRLALATSLLQIPVGLWVVMTLPELGKQAIMGRDMAATSLFGVSVLAALGLLYVLASISLGAVDRRNSIAAMVLMAVVILLMTATLKRTRIVAPREPRTPPVSSDALTPIPDPSDDDDQPPPGDDDDRPVQQDDSDDQPSPEQQQLDDDDALQPAPAPAGERTENSTREETP